MIAAHASPVEVSGWQAAMLAVYLANNMSGDGVGQLIWRVCEKIVFLGGCLLRATTRGVDEFYRLCLDTLAQPDGDMGVYVGEELKRVEQWLWEHRQSVAANPIA